MIRFVILRGGSIEFIDRRRRVVKQQDIDERAHVRHLSRIAA